MRPHQKAYEKYQFSVFVAYAEFLNKNQRLVRIYIKLNNAVKETLAHFLISNHHCERWSKCQKGKAITFHCQKIATHRIVFLLIHRFMVIIRCHGLLYGTSAYSERIQNHLDLDRTVICVLVRPCMPSRYKFISTNLQNYAKLHGNLEMSFSSEFNPVKLY